MDIFLQISRDSPPPRHVFGLSLPRHKSELLRFIAATWLDVPNIDMIVDGNEGLYSLVAVLVQSLTIAEQLSLELLLWELEDKPEIWESIHGEFTLEPKDGATLLSKLLPWTQSIQQYVMGKKKSLLYQVIVEVPFNETINERLLKFRQFTKKCPICSETRHKNRFPKSITRHCGHLRDICEICISTHIRISLEGNNHHITCPGEECGSPLSRTRIRRWSDDDTFARYNELASAAFIHLHPDFHVCLAPDCPSGQLHEEVEEELAFADDLLCLRVCDLCGLSCSVA